MLARAFRYPDAHAWCETVRVIACFGRLLVVMLAFAGACTTDGSGAPGDVPPVDGGSVDGGSVDGGSVDGGSVDGGVDDAGVERLDGLPVVRLDTHPDLSRDGYTPAQITLGGKRHQGAQAKYRGATSFTYPKKSFTLKFEKGNRLDDATTGFSQARKVVLISSFDDNSYVRQALAFTLWNRLDPEQIQVRTAFVVLVLNGRYHGLYLMADHIDRHLVADHGLWEGGNLYKARTHAADFRTARNGKAKSPHEGFTKEEGLPVEGQPEAFADLDAFVRWLDSAEADALAEELPERIDVRDYGNWWILVSLIDALDSAGKNSYHYRDSRPDAPDPRFRCVPWDFNMSFGQDWQSKRVGATQTFSRYGTMNRVFERLLSSRMFSPQILARYRQALDSELSLAWVAGWLEVTRAQIAAAARRDEALWGEQYRSYFEGRNDYTDFEAESEYVDRWIDARWDFVASQLEAR